MAARGAGQYSTGYGKIEDMVLALEIVTPSGIIRTKDYPATAQGWDLDQIFLGSEGTLGVITEVTMKIRKHLPQNRAYASFIFKDFKPAVDTMRGFMQAQCGRPHLFRISDPEETDIAFKMKGFEGRFSDRFLKMKGYLPLQRCLMFIAVEGDPDYTRLVIKKIKKMARQYGAFSTGAGPTKKWLEQRYFQCLLTRTNDGFGNYVRHVGDCDNLGKTDALVEKCSCLHQIQATNGVYGSYFPCL